MGDAQSAQREDKKDAAAEEGSGGVDDVQTEENPEDKVLCYFLHLFMHRKELITSAPTLQ